MKLKCEVRTYHESVLALETGFRDHLIIFDHVFTVIKPHYRFLTMVYAPIQSLGKVRCPTPRKDPGGRSREFWG